MNLEKNVKGGENMSENGERRENYGTGQSSVDWQIFNLRTRIKDAAPEQRLELLCERRLLRAVTRGMQQTNAVLKDSVPIGVDGSYFK